MIDNIDTSKRMSAIDDIRQLIDSYVDKKVRVTVIKQRNKIDTFDAIVQKAHPQLFSVETRRKRVAPTIQTFRYVEVLTKDVLVFDGEENIFAEILNSIDEEVQGSLDPILSIACLDDSDIKEKLNG